MSLFIFLTQTWEKGTSFCLLVGSGSFFGLCDIYREYTKTYLCFLLPRCMFFLLLVAWQTADIWRRHHWCLREMTSEEWHQKFCSDDVSVPRSRWCFWLVKAKFFRGTTNQKHHHDLVVTRHQYGISALISQTSFCGNPVVASQNVGCFLRLFFK